MPVAFLTSDIYKDESGTWYPGGCAYYRCFLPMNAVGGKSAMGRPVFDSGRGFGVMDSKDGVFGYGTVMLKLVMQKWTPRQVELAREVGQRIVVDVDDYYEGLPEENLAFHITNPETNKVTNRDHYAKVIERADTLTVSTPFLLDQYRDKHPDVRLVRNGVVPGMFHVKRHRNEKPVIGWAGSTSFRGGDLEILAEWLPGFLEKHDLMFHHAGHSPMARQFHEVVGIPEERMKTSPLLPIDLYPIGLQEFDIGIVPLNDIPFNHAKSCIKGLEYAASGIPFVASASPEYEYLKATGVGRIARTATEWVDQLQQLLDYKTRKREAAIQRKIVMDLHSMEQRAADWRAVFSLS